MAGNLESRIIPLSNLFSISSPYRSEYDDPNSDVIKPDEPSHEVNLKGQEVTGATLFSLSDQTNALILKFNDGSNGMQVLLNGAHDPRQNIVDQFIGSRFLGKSVDVPHGLFPTKGLVFAKPDGASFCLECYGSVPNPVGEKATMPPM